jgi:hypothetical protein
MIHSEVVRGWSFNAIGEQGTSPWGCMELDRRTLNKGKRNSCLFAEQENKTLLPKACRNEMSSKKKHFF